MDLEEFYMQRIFKSVKQAFRKSILILALMSLISLSGLFIFAAEPSYAAPVSNAGQKLIQQEQMDKQSEVANLRNQDYEEQVKASEDIDKVYEENLKASGESEPGIVEKAVEGAKGLVDKVAGNE